MSSPRSLAWKPPIPDPIELPARSLSWVSRLGAFIELTKPRINFMVLLTVAVGFQLGSPDRTNLLLLVQTVLGTGLVAAGSSAWNQVLERYRDAQMRRTRNRPLPSGRVTVGEAALLGSVLGMTGTAILVASPHPLAAWVALATFALYVLIYTPLKGFTTLNTAVGAIPGALPPVIGWAAATGQLGVEALALFLILFLWQFPHFLAIAWLYRDDYALGGLKMLPIGDPSGRMTGRQAAQYALALIPAALLPVRIGLAGTAYFTGALIVGTVYAVAAIRFWGNVSDASARRLLRASFLHLPLILLLLYLDRIPL